MNLSLFLNLFLLFSLVFASKKQALSEPIPTLFTDDTQIITLAKNQKFTLPITTRTITHKLQMFPQDTNQCELTSQSMLYKPLSSVSFMIEDQQEITNMISLPKKQKMFLVDEGHNIYSYSLDQHFMLKELAPKNKFAGISGKVTTLALAATEDENYVYFITPEKYYIFTVESLGLDVVEGDKLQGDLQDVQKAFIYRGNLVLLSARKGLLIYKIDKSTRRLGLAQRFTFPQDYYFADMQFEPSTQMLYLLTMNRAILKIFHFKPSDFPNPDKSLTIFVEYDTIQFSSITSKHQSSSDQKNMHINLQISKGREQQTLMVLFWHKYHFVIAQMVYNVNLMRWSFVRYFKFAMRVNEIHIINDIVAVVGSQSMGIFPFGIHPRLIDEEVNGQMALTSMLKINLLENGRFVGLSKNSIQYGVIKLEQQAQLNCKIQQNSKLKTVKILANLTACSSQDRFLYQNYCAYQKTFTLSQMQMTVSAPIANILWTGMFFFLLIIILGICVIFAMQKNKEEEIKRLQVYFEEKKKAPPSERRTIDHL